MTGEVLDPPLAPRDWPAEMLQAPSPPCAARAPPPPPRAGAARPKGLNVLSTLARHPPRPAYHAFNGHVLFATACAALAGLLVLRVAAVRDAAYSGLSVVMADDSRPRQRRDHRVAEGPGAGVGAAGAAWWPPSASCGRSPHRRRHLAGAGGRARPAAAHGPGVHRGCLRRLGHGLQLVRGVEAATLVRSRGSSPSLSGLALASPIPRR